MSGYGRIPLISTLVVILVVFVIMLVPTKTARVQQTAVNDNYQTIMDNIIKHGKTLEENHPDFMKSFQEIGPAVFKPGALDTKTKELICMGIAVANRCDGCIAFHTRRALKTGATEKEIVEALSVAIFMGGGPSYVYATHVIEVMEEFKQTN